MSEPEPPYLCPVDVPLRHLGGKWKLIVCFYLCSGRAVMVS